MESDLIWFIAEVLPELTAFLTALASLIYSMRNHRHINRLNGQENTRRSTSGT